MSLHRIDTERRLYVLDEGRGYSCLGFDVAFKRALAVAQWCDCERPTPELVGTPEGYAEYERIMSGGATYHRESRTRCLVELHPQLSGLEGRRVEVVDADGETRRFWVGRSTGWLPCHLEIARQNSSDGMATDSKPFRSVRVVR